jgi:predicted SAM-dependent methyltransferase
MNWEQLLQVEPEQKLVVEIGANQKPQARFIDGWKEEKDAKILTLDVDEKQKPNIVADAADMPPELYEKLDGLLASHVLEHFSYWKTDEVLAGWIRCLKEGGEIHILVPSLEWAAREVLSENPSPAVYAQLYAGQINQWDVHLTGFTMRKLRALLEKSGISVNVARTGVYHLQVGKVGVFEAMQHYISGVKGNPVLKRQ